MNLVSIVLGAALILAVIALIFAPRIREWFRRDTSAISTAEGRPARPAATAVRVHTGIHRAGVR